LHCAVLYIYFPICHCFILYRSHKKKRGKQIKKLMQRGLLDPEKADPFSLFMETSDITYCLYRDSERVLGNTFGMCILQVLPETSLLFHLAEAAILGFLVAEFSLLLLQDFEALTPNLLARTIETVEGGGLIILLLRSLSSLTSLYTMVMVSFISPLHFNYLSPIHSQLSKEF
jgi:N-acetyltransferase 10